MTAEKKVISRGECGKCNSSDGNVLYADGSKYCFVCNTYSHSDNSNSHNDRKIYSMTTTTQLSRGNVLPITDRNISQATAQHYGVTQTEGKHFYPYYDVNGSQVANKVRHTANKSFMAEGSMSKATLFGQQLFNQGGKYITICEGEIDAMSAYEMTGSKWPVVSIRNGAQSAVKDCKEQFEYLNKFEQIVICFDNDEHGIAAAQKVAQIFEPNKAKIMHMSLKDANEYLKAGKREQFVRAWWEARPYTPAGIIRLCDYIDEMFEDDDQDTVLYPFKGLNDKLYGIRTGELVTVTAGTGAGKTSMMYELEYHILKNTTCNIGIIHLEENRKQTNWHLVSIPANKRLFLKEERMGMSKEELQPFIDDTVGDPRLIAFNHFGSIGTEEILSRVRYMVKALDCKYIIIDHLSILVSGIDEGDERRNIDLLMTKLRSLVEETQCGMLLVAHLRRGTGDAGHEQGKEVSLSMLRGSHSIAQLSDAVIALERDQQAKDAVSANTTTVRVLKNRYAGETGVATFLLYNTDSGRMTEIDDPNKEDFEEINQQEYL